ncbi:hypothetical protein AB3M89_08225 [Microbacterium sp. 179-I 3D2 NHS]|uniref:hypothetical protein n=1 Tax=Microbacterium sp. 179-I 3D2 NHS TaxID=3235178 RepID=UPI0039A0C9FF
MRRAMDRARMRGILPPLTIVVLVGIYAVVLHGVYAGQVSPAFDYLGYRYRDPGAGPLILSTAIAAGTALTLPRRLATASSVVLWVLFTVTVAPTVLMSTYTSYLDPARGLALAALVGMVFSIVALGQNPAPRPLGFRLRSPVVWTLVGLFTAATFVLLGVVQGLSFELVGILDVYDVRADFAEKLESVGILSYLVATQANVVNPWIAARGVLERRWWLVGVAIIAQLVLYSTTGYKHVLFAIAAWLVMLIVLQPRKERTPGSILLAGATAMVVVAAVVDQLLSTNLATSLFSRRFILTPGMLSTAYVRFFSDNPQAHLGYSVLRPFVDYPYDETPPYLVGAMITNGKVIASNANLFADGFANFGWLGVAGAGAVLLVYLRLVDRASVGLPILMSAIVLIIPAVALSNASVLTSMLSHGLVVAFGLLALTPRPHVGALGIDLAYLRSPRRRQSPVFRVRS